MVRLSHVASLFVATAVGASGQLTSTGLSVLFNEVNYFISPYSAGSITTDLGATSSIPSVFGFVPVTVVSDSSIIEDDLPTLVGNWTCIDDVFQPAFLGVVFLLTVETCPEARTIQIPTNTTGEIAAQVFPLVSNNTKPIPNGPYFLDKSTGNLHSVYRLYDDFAGSFTESLFQHPETATFQPLSARVPSSATLTIGVPSRLYYTRTPDKPLAGVRIAIKDIYQLAGVRSSYGSRAWYNLYGPSNKTGTAVSRLLDAGAVVVGLQKPSQFANGETATADWVDYHSPFNPRADGYQDPSSSSSGAGASVASYDWLDVALGSDTGGSIRGPAASQGIFGNRPSHGLVSLDHVMPLSTALDTAGFLLRDPTLWDDLNAVMYAGNYTSLGNTDKPVYPKKIYTIGFPEVNSTVGKIMHGFADALADFVGGEKSESMDPTNMWAQSPPADVPGNMSLASFVNLTYAMLITKEQTALVREPFYTDYAARHDNRLPFLDPVPLARWGWSDQYPDSALQEAQTNKTIFQTWFNDQVLPSVEDLAQCSSALVLYPGSDGTQVPRNVYWDAPTKPPLGWSNGRISVLSGCPDSVFPLGQVEKFSNITNHTEYFPVTVDILAARGCDGLLARLAVDLLNAGVLAVPKTGQTIHGGEILM